MQLLFRRINIEVHRKSAKQTQQSVNVLVHNIMFGWMRTWNIISTRRGQTVTQWFTLPRELRLLCFIPLSGNTCKSHFYFAKD